MLGLPSSLESCVFELDGVLANSAAMHRAAWAETFDGFLLRRSSLTSHDVIPFDPRGDYETYIDGRPRLEGVRVFLGVVGSASPAVTKTIHPKPRPSTGSPTTSKRRFGPTWPTRGSSAFGGSRQYLTAARHAGLRRAVVSVSENTTAMFDLSGLARAPRSVVDGETMRAEGLQLRPEPDTFLAAARRLGVAPERAAVFVHDLVGVTAARAGEFGTSSWSSEAGRRR